MSTLLNGQLAITIDCRKLDASRRVSFFGGGFCRHLKLRAVEKLPLGVSAAARRTIEGVSNFLQAGCATCQREFERNYSAIPNLQLKANRSQIAELGVSELIAAAIGDAQPVA